jgi:hypothetical protein
MKSLIITSAFFLGMGSITFYPNDAKAIIPVEESADLLEIFNDQGSSFSPLHGLVALHNGQIESDFIQTKDNEGDLSKLLHSLFFENQDKEVIPSSIVKNPVSHLGPSTMAKIVQKMSKGHHNESSETIQDSFYQLITQDEDYLLSLKEAKKRIEGEEQIHQDFLKRYEEGRQFKVQTEAIDKNEIGPLRKKINELKKKIKAAEGKDNQQDLLIKLNDELSLIEKNLKEKQEQFQELSKGIVPNKALSDQEKRIKHLRGIFDTQNEVYQQSLNELSQRLAKISLSHQLVKEKALTYLLAFMVGKANSKKDLHPYFREMQRSGFLIQKKKMGFINDPIKTQQYYDHVLTSRYTSEDFKLAQQQLEKSFFKKKFAKNHTEILFTMNVLRPQMKKTPPQIKFQLLTKNKNSLPYPNCGENSLRNVLNTLFFDPKTSTIDQDLIQSLKADPDLTIDDDLISFYQRHGDPHEIQTDTIHNEWNEVVSEKNDLDQSADTAVKYLYGQDRQHPYGQCQIKPAYKNMKNLLKKLLGTSDLKIIVDKIKTLRKDREIIFNDQDVDEQTGRGQATLEDSESIAQWDFGIGHFYFSKSDKPGRGGVGKSIHDLFESVAPLFQTKQKTTLDKQKQFIFQSTYLKYQPKKASDTNHELCPPQL